MTKLIKGGYLTLQNYKGNPERNQGNGKIVSDEVFFT